MTQETEQPASSEAVQQPAGGGSTASANGSGKIGFSGFALKTKKKELAEGLVRREDIAVEEPELIDAIDAGAVNSVNKKEEQGPVVIPLPVYGKGKKVGIAAAAAAAEMSEADKEAEAALLAEVNGEDNENKENVSLNVPMLLANRPDGWDDLKDDAEKYKADMAWRPEAPTLADYEKVKVEDIGAGMLRGMGWEPGKPVGREGKFARVVEPIEFLKRPSGLGLGASMAAAPERKKKKYIRPGESRDTKQEFFVTQSGKSKRFLDEKLVKRRSTALELDSIVTIEAGPHKGLFGKVVMLDAEWSHVKLSLNQQEVKVPRADVRVETDVETFRARRKRDREEEDTGKKEGKREKKEKKVKKEKKEKKKRSWMTTGIKVRVVERSFKSGKYYSKKGKVVDIIGNGEASVMMDEGELIDIHEEHLETALPKVGGTVLVLRGEHKGRRAKLLERSSSQDLARVQLDNDQSIQKYTLEEVAEYAPLRNEDDDEDF